MPTIEENQKAIAALEKAAAVRDAKMDNMLQQITEIKTNHLVHINDNLTAMAQNISFNNTALTKLVNDKMETVYQMINALKLNDARQEPGNKLFNKIIEYVILGVIGIIIAIIAGAK